MDFRNEFGATDSIWVAGTRYTVSALAVSGNALTLNELVVNTNVLTNVPVYKWANGYVWDVEYSSHVGDQPQLAHARAELGLVHRERAPVAALGPLLDERVQPPALRGQQLAHPQLDR